MSNGPYQALQTVAMGLVIVFVDAGRGGWDWVPDPLGWILVLAGLAPLKGTLPNRDGLLWFGAACLALSVFVYPPTSVANVEESLGWAFSLPTLAFCFVLCDALAEVLTGGLATAFATLRTLYVVVAVLPVLIFGAGWDGLTIPTAVTAVGVNVALVLALWQASGVAAPGEDEGTAGEGRAQRPGSEKRKDDDGRSRSEKATPKKKPAGSDSPPSGKAADRAKPGKKKPQVTGEDVLEKVRRRRRARNQDTDL